MSLALKKACCCGGSLRICSLILLFIFLIKCIWGMALLFKNMNDHTYINYMSDSEYIEVVEIVILAIGALICLLTIISIFKDFQRTGDLLNAIIVFLIVFVIFFILGIILTLSNDSIDAQIDAQVNAEITKDLYKVPRDLQDLYRQEIEKLKIETKDYAIRLMYFSAVANLLFSFYAILIFYSYKVEREAR